MAAVVFELMTLECARPKTTSVPKGLIEEICLVAYQLATIRRFLLIWRRNPPIVEVEGS
jgi:hypothetical protein